MAEAVRFDPYHKGVGAGGGQFTSAGGGSGGSSGKTHAGHAAGHGSGGGNRAARQHELRQKAAADRAEAHRLQAQLHSLEKQQKAAKAASASSSRKAGAASAAKPGSAAHKTAVHHRRHASVHHHRAVSLTKRISTIRVRIHQLLAQAKHLDAEAAAL